MKYVVVDDTEDNPQPTVWGPFDTRDEAKEHALLLAGLSAFDSEYPAEIFICLLESPER